VTAEPSTRGGRNAAAPVRVDLFLLAGLFPGASHADTLRHAVSYAMAAEAAGFHGVGGRAPLHLLRCVPVGAGDPEATLANIARLGTDVLPALRGRPEPIHAAVIENGTHYQ
jgi:hypothetical protein